MSLVLHEALAYQRKLLGQTDPYLIRIDAEPFAVVKLICQHGCVCLKEYLAICMARALGLNTLTPIQVNISADFVEMLPQNALSAHQFGGHTTVPAFGTYYEKALLTPVADDLCVPELRKALLSIFCFDLLIRNFDRTLKNPNLLLDREQKPDQLWVIDHEMAFLYGFSDSVDKELWRLAEEEQIIIQAHCAYLPLREAFQQDYTLYSQLLYQMIQKFKTAFAADSDFWVQVWQAVPLLWRNQDEYARLKSSISAVGVNSAEMHKMILEVLSR